MALETASTIAGLDPNNPVPSDPVGQGDDHLRLIKTVLKDTFPGAASAGFAIPIIATEAELNYVHGVTSNIQSQFNFLQAGTGAVTRTTQNKLRDYVSDKDFGVIGDGVADDTAALNLAGASGRAVLLTGTSYKINGVVTGNFYQSTTTALIYTGTDKFHVLGLIQPTTGLLFSDTGAVINRLGDRLFLGDANVMSGDSTSTVKTWAGATAGAKLQPNYGWIEKNSLTVSYASKGIGIAGGTRTSQLTGGAAIGVSSIAYNDNTVNSVNAWALYLDSKRAVGSLGAAFGTEIELTEMGSYTDLYSVATTKTIGISLSAGGDPAVNGTTDSCTIGLQITNNGANWGRGIAFGSSSLRPFTDSESLTHYKAIVLRNAMQLGWEDASGGSCGFLRSSITTSASEVSMLLANNNVYVRGATGLKIAQFGHVASAVNYAYISNNATGFPVQLSALGDDANIDIRFNPKGTGYMRFGTFGATADVVCNGYITIKDASGALRKLMTTA